MKRLVVLLSISAAGFVCSTVYLSMRLHEVRSGPIVERPVANESAETTRPVSYEPPSSSRSGAEKPAEFAPHAPSPAASTEPRWRKRQREISAAFMRRYEDPAQRAEMLADEKAALRRTTRKFGDVARLSEDELSQLLDLLAQNKLERTVADHACTLDTRCNPVNYSFPDRERQVAAIAAYLGPDRYQKYQDFRMSATERSLVEQLRERVVASSVLRDSDAEKLISALWDERRRYLEDAERRGLLLTTSTTRLGPVIMRTNAEGTERLLSQETQEFRARLDARASQILTAEQLKAFKELQDQALRGTSNFRMGP